MIKTMIYFALTTEKGFVISYIDGIVYFFTIIRNISIFIITYLITKLIH